MKRPRNHILLRLYLQHSKSAKFYIGQIDLQYGFKIINMWYMLCTLMVIFIDEYGMMFTKCSKCHHVIMRVKIHINHRTLISQVRIHRYSISCKITTVIIHTGRLHENFKGNIISFLKEIYCIKILHSLPVSVFHIYAALSSLPPITKVPHGVIVLRICSRKFRAPW